MRHFFEYRGGFDESWTSQAFDLVNSTELKRKDKNELCTALSNRHTVITAWDKRIYVFTNDDVVGECWANFRSHPKVNCNIQDDDFTTSSRSQVQNYD